MSTTPLLNLEPVIDSWRVSHSSLPASRQGSPEHGNERVSNDYLLTPLEDYLYWAFIGPDNRLAPQDTDDLMACVADMTRDWHPRLKTLFDCSDLDTLAIMPVRRSRVSHDWKAGPVTLLGDAIHAMSPAGGLGANTALQDAASLATLLSDVIAERKSLENAISTYETDLRVRATEAIDASDESARKLFEFNAI